MLRSFTLVTLQILLSRICLGLHGRLKLACLSIVVWSGCLRNSIMSCVLILVQSLFKSLGLWLFFAHKRLPNSVLQVLHLLTFLWLLSSLRWLFSSFCDEKDLIFFLVSFCLLTLVPRSFPSVGSKVRNWLTLVLSSLIESFFLFECFVNWIGGDCICKTILVRVSQLKSFRRSWMLHLRLEGLFAHFVPL